jgi:hypothetical protein
MRLRAIIAGLADMAHESDSAPERAGAAGTMAAGQ